MAGGDFGPPGSGMLLVCEAAVDNLQRLRHEMEIKQKNLESLPRLLGMHKSGGNGQRRQESRWAQSFAHSSLPGDACSDIGLVNASPQCGRQGRGSLVVRDLGFSLSLPCDGCIM